MRATRTGVGSSWRTAALKPVAPGIRLWSPTDWASLLRRASLSVWLSTGSLAVRGARPVAGLHAARRVGRVAARASAAAAAVAGQRGLCEHVAAVGVLVDVAGDVVARVAELLRRVMAGDAAVLALAQDLLADARARRAEQRAAGSAR